MVEAEFSAIPRFCGTLVRREITAIDHTRTGPVKGALRRGTIAELHDLAYGACCRRNSISTDPPVVRAGSRSKRRSAVGRLQLGEKKARR